MVICLSTGHRLGNRKKKRKRNSEEESDLLWNQLFDGNDDARRFSDDSSSEVRKEQSESNGKDRFDEWFQAKDSISEMDNELNPTTNHITARNNGHIEQATNNRIKSNRLPKFWLTACLLFSGILFWKAAPETDKPVLTPSATAATTSSESAEPQFVTKPIEHVQLGERVLGTNPQATAEERAVPDPDPKTWRKITLHLDKPIGGDITVELLRDLNWIASQQARVGSSIYLDLKHLGASGNAKILEIEPCPEITEGSGNVVTGKFIHASSEILDIYLNGSYRPIGTTAAHPFWSEDRQDFVTAGQLRIGETLRSVSGETVWVTDIARRGPPETVYNLEIHAEHVYHVSKQAVLVHNACHPKKPTFSDGMSAGDAKKYNEHWTGDVDYTHGAPFGTKTTYTPNGKPKTVTTFDEHGRPHRQYGLRERHPPHEHNFEFPKNPKRPPGPGFKPDRKPGRPIGSGE